MSNPNHRKKLFEKKIKDLVNKRLKMQENLTDNALFSSNRSSLLRASPYTYNVRINQARSCGKVAYSSPDTSKSGNHPIGWPGWPVGDNLRRSLPGKFLYFYLYLYLCMYKCICISICISISISICITICICICTLSKSGGEKYC